jgi:CRP-like cAMP-binding protein
MVDSAFLSRIPIFGALGVEELGLVSGLLEERAYDPGAVIVREGASGRELYVIVDGRADILKRSPDGSETKIAELGPGACFGEMALVGIMTRSATAVARSRLVALVLPYAGIAKLSETHLPTFTLLVMNLARELCRRLRDADAMLAEFGLPATLPQPAPGSGRGH